jgi:hypothetical protein
MRGQILKELDAIRSRGVIKLIDVLIVHKDDAGNISARDITDVTEEELAEYGNLLRNLLGIDHKGDRPSGPSKTEGSRVSGITREELLGLVDDIPPGTVIAVMLFEHTWAAGFAQAAREAGGHLLAQGILTRDAVMVVGRELEAIAEAEMVIEAAEAVKAAALLDALAFSEAIEELEESAAAEVDELFVETRTLAAAETLRTLTVAGLIDDKEIEPALTELVDAGLLDRQMVEDAFMTAGEIQAEVADVAYAQSSRGTDT